MGRVMVVDALWNEPIETFPPSASDKVQDLNLKALFFLAVLGQLEQASTADDPAGAINIGSVYGLQASVLGTVSYAASKAGLHHMTRVLACELGPRGITVNAIAPGPFASRIYSPDFVEESTDEIDGVTPFSRVGADDDIVGVTRFLPSRAGAYITGAVLPVDGG